MYDPTIGRWLSEDPIGFTAGDTNLYRYVTNGPTNWADSSGLNPNKKGVKSLNEFMDIVRTYQEEHKNESQEDILAGLKTHLKAQDDWSYIHTKVGWIDVQHLIEAAYRSRTIKASVIIIGGIGVECLQLVLGPFASIGSPSSGQYASAFSAEDLPSNTLGVLFGTEWDGEQPLADALEAFLVKLETSNDPTQISSYENLPKDELTYVQNTSWYTPILKTGSFFGKFSTGDYTGVAMALIFSEY